MFEWIRELLHNRKMTQRFYAHRCWGYWSCGAGSALYSISKLEPLVTVERVNVEFSNLFDSLIVERPNKPHPLTDFLNPGNGFASKPTAAQNFAFIKHLPHILKMLMKKEAFLPFLKLLVILQEIVCIVFSPKATDSLLAHFSSLVASFLSKFKLL